VFHAVTSKNWILLERPTPFTPDQLARADPVEPLNSNLVLDVGALPPAELATPAHLSRLQSATMYGSRNDLRNSIQLKVGSKEQFIRGVAFGLGLGAPWPSGGSCRRIALCASAGELLHPCR
jgi:hypothetical protein